MPTPWLDYGSLYLGLMKPKRNRGSESTLGYDYRPPYEMEWRDDSVNAAARPGQKYGVYRQPQGQRTVPQRSLWQTLTNASDPVYGMPGDPGPMFSQYRNRYDGPFVDQNPAGQNQYYQLQTQQPFASQNIQSQMNFGGGTEPRLLPSQPVASQSIQSQMNFGGGLSSRLSGYRPLVPLAKTKAELTDYMDRKLGMPEAEMREYNRWAMGPLPFHHPRTGGLHDMVYDKTP